MPPSLEAADTARGAWYAATAATRDAAHRASIELRTRGIDLADLAQRYRVPTVDETAQAVARVQNALAEIEARRQYDQTHEQEEARRQELARWAGQDRAAEQAQHTRDDESVRHC